MMGCSERHFNRVLGTSSYKCDTNNHGGDQRKPKKSVRVFAQYCENKKDVSTVTGDRTLKRKICFCGRTVFFLMLNLIVSILIEGITLQNKQWSISL